MSAIDWPGTLRAALRLGLPPQQFWRLSLAEWRALTGTGSPLARQALQLLMARYPDETP